MLWALMSPTRLKYKFYEWAWITLCLRAESFNYLRCLHQAFVAWRQAFYLICLGHRQEICRYRARTALLRWYEIHQTATNSLRMRRRADCWRIVRRVQCSFDRWVQTAQQGVARVTMHTGQLALWLHQGNSKHCIVARGLQKWSKVAVSRRLRRGKLRRADQFRSRRVLHRTFFQLWLHTTDYRQYDRRCNHASEELRDPTNNAEYDKHSKRAAVDQPAPQWRVFYPLSMGFRQCMPLLKASLGELEGVPEMWEPKLKRGHLPFINLVPEKKKKKKKKKAAAKE
eukprot:FR743470.1.p1 GENE.FR743470.1~~FR743470.1.p1  ORF type:complete len:297 (+),score=11.26 FR743470.1:40-891(+)